ncbi:MAG: hypothetical protein PUB18_02290 [bacterium]|nr:hypothetical protein [bacterium]
MKKKIILIVIIVLLLGIVGFVLYQVDPIRFKISYEYINLIEDRNGKKIKIKVPYDNGIQYLNEKEILTYLKKETGIFYFGYNTCPWCRNIVPILIHTAKTNHIDTIYYIDTYNLNLTSIKQELFDFLGDNLREDETGKKRLAVPDVYFIKEGKIIGHHIGSVESYHNPYQEMNDSQKQELISIYEQWIKEMKK